MDIGTRDMGTRGHVGSSEIAQGFLPKKIEEDGQFTMLTSSCMHLM